MKERYDELIKDIKAFEAALEADGGLAKAKERYYRGIQVLFSPLKFQPTFMFIGINPGIGFYKSNDRNVKRFEPLRNFEYLVYNYQLAAETKKIFSGDLSVALKDSIKTNCYFLSTATEKDLHSLLGHIKDKYNIYYKSRLWMEELIDIVQPKIIICEGGSAFKRVMDKYGIDITEQHGHFYGNYKGTPVIGYRRRSSYIAEKPNLTKLIRKVYAEVLIDQTSVLG